MREIPKGVWLTAALLALAGGLGYGGLGIFVRMVTAEGLPLAVVLAWRFTLAALALLPHAVRRLGAMPARDRGLGVAMGVFGFATMSFTYTSAIGLIGAGKAAVLLYFYPCLVMAIDWVASKARPKPALVAVLVASTLGCALTAYVPGETRGSVLVGVLLGLASAALYAVYLVVGNRVGRRSDPLLVAFLVSVGAALVFWAALAVTGYDPLPTSARQWGLLAGLALLSTVLPMAAIFAAMRRIGPMPTALLSTAEPVFAVVLGAALLGEAMTPTQVFGAALVVAAAAALAAFPRLGARR